MKRCLEFDTRVRFSDGECLQASFWKEYFVEGRWLNTLDGQ
jgi:hypothetical protein